MMGGVNTAPDYYHKTMKFGHPGPDKSPVIDDGLKQGGIVSIYYVGTLMGCLAGGWFGDRYGRIKTIGLGALWGVIGACLQTSAMNATWMIFGKFLTSSQASKLICSSSPDQRMGHWNSQCHRSRLGYRNL